jgi:ABC-type branched-subunit amino acid transport system substrate-binding protein
MGYEVRGIVTALDYSAALTTPGNRKFAQAYEGRFKQIPSYYSEVTYMGGLQLKRALEAISGEAENAERLAGPCAKQNSLILLEGRFGLTSTVTQSRTSMSARWSGWVDGSRTACSHFSKRFAVLDI